MSERPRPMTPFAAFDPLSSVPKLPRAPQLPSDIGELPVGADHEMRDTERTPPDGPFGIRQILQRLEKFDQDFTEMKRHCSQAASTALQTHALVQTLTGEVDALKRRMTAYELADRWVPRIAWAVTTLIAVIALARTYR